MERISCSDCGLRLTESAAICLAGGQAVCASCFDQWAAAQARSASLVTDAADYTEVIEAPAEGMRNLFWNATFFASGTVALFVVMCWIVCFPIGLRQPIGVEQFFHGLAKISGVLLGIGGVLATLATPVLFLSFLGCRAGYPRRVRLSGGSIIVEAPECKAVFPLSRSRWFVGKAFHAPSGLDRRNVTAILIYSGESRILCGLTDESRACWIRLLTHTSARRIAGDPEPKGLLIRVAIAAFSGKLGGVLLGIVVNRFGPRPEESLPLILGISGAILFGFLALVLSFGEGHRRSKASRQPQC